MTIDAYLPILLFAVIATVFGAGSVMASNLIVPKHPTPAKLAPYECGITPLEPEIRTRFPVKFYVIAMLFIVFDVETVFLFPWAVVFRKLGAAGVAEMGAFIAFLLAAYVYVWKRGGLEWE